MNQLIDLNSPNIPRTAIMFAGLGGTFILIEGIIAIFFRSIVWAIAQDIWVGLSVVFIGILLVMNALIIQSSTVGLAMRPSYHVAEGITIMIFALLALMFGGGYIIGSMFAFTGGLMAIMWRPKVDQPAAGAKTT